jgi:acyl carrier protein
MSTAPVPDAQEGLWLLQALDQGSRAYNVTGALRLTGPLDTAALVAAVAAVLGRHAALRSAFPAHQGAIHRTVLPPGRPPLALRDLTDLSGPRQEAAMAAEIDAAVTKDFDLAAGPLFTLKLLRLAPQVHVLLLSAHHIVADGWAMDVIYRELSACYRQLAQEKTPSLPSPPDYDQYARLRRERLEAGALDASARHWSGRLDGLPAEITLPGRRPRPETPSRPAVHHAFTLEGELVGQIQALSRRAGSTVFTTLLAIYSLTLHQMSGQPALPVGIVAANRDRPGTADLVGMLANLLPIPVSIDRRTSFAGHLWRLRDEILLAREHQEFPFARIVDTVRPRRVPGAPVLVQVLFDLEYRQAEPLDLPGITVEALPIPAGTAKFDLSLIVRDCGEQLEHVLEYDAELFDEPWAAEFATAYRTVARAAVSDPGAPVGRLLGQSPGTPAAWPPAVPARVSAAIRSESGVPDGPDGAAGRLVRQVCADILGQPELTLADNFFEAGGNSLLAVRLVYSLFEETGVTVSPSQVLRCATLRELAAAIATGPRPGRSEAAAQ